MEQLSGTATGVVATELEKAGNFSQDFDRNGNLIVIYDPLTTRQLPNGTYTRDPFPGNIIPANRLSTVARNMVKDWPKADTQVSGANGLSNYQYTSPIPTHADQFMNKGEVKITGSVSVTGLYLFQNSSEQHTHFWKSPTGDYVATDDPLAAVGPDQGDELRQIHVVALNNTMVLNSSTTASLRYGYTRFNDHVLGHPSDISKLGFPASYVNAIQYGRYPNGTIQGYSVGTGGTFGNRPESVVDYPQWNVNGSLSKLVGRHTTKVGADWRTIGANANQPQGASGGTFNFDKEWTQASPPRAERQSRECARQLLLGLPSANAGNLQPLRFDLDAP